MAMFFCAPSLRPDGGSFLWPLLVYLSFLSLPRVIAKEEEEMNDESSEPANAILFPFFALSLGVLVYLLLSRLLPFLPSTAVMFLLGTFMGIGVRRLENSNLLNESISDYWLKINGEVLLLVFLPALIYKDATGLNFHLFQVAIWQCLIFAFPMVLAGTTLTALVAYYVFPYDWSFHLAMTFGSILSATDPVAVSALLEEVGAPPRLQIHISGESLLNDGSAIVFYSIFGGLYLLELGIPGLGQDYTWGEGIAKFFRMSAGGVGVGIAFGLGHLVILRLLRWRLNRTENMVEVASTITVAYLCYYTADVTAGTSGIIATLTLGVLTQAFGRAFMNDMKLLEDFWSLVEWLLNTVLFTLGGLVWGSIISNEDPYNPNRLFTGRDWGYLVLLYVLLMAIRFALFVTAFPIISRIGLKSNWQEMIFHAYSGLRGAVGISLAIALDNVVRKNVSEETQKYELQTNKLFGFVGGIAFMTLLINATMAAKLLRKLGLTGSTSVREKMLKTYREHHRMHAIDKFIALLAQKRFHRVSFALVRHHVPMLADLTRQEVIEAARRYHDADSQNDDYRKPKLKNVLPYLEKLDDDVCDLEKSHKESYSQLVKDNRRSAMVTSTRSIMRTSAVADTTSVVELRRVFLELLRSAYEHQIKFGELAGREFITFSLEQSLDFAADDMTKDKPLNDWEYVKVLDIPLEMSLRKSKPTTVLLRCIEGFIGPFARVETEFAHMRVDIERALAFMHAHNCAQGILKREFLHCEFSSAGQQVLRESEEEYRKAESSILEYPEEDVEVVVSHKFCTIILNNAVLYTEYLAESGLLKEREAHEFLEEIQEAMRNLDSCDMREHPGELTNAETSHSSAQPPERWVKDVISRDTLF